MPVLSNPRHEKFAQELAKGASQTEAYERAGFKRDGGAASRLSGNVSVHARVRELQEISAGKATLTRSWVLERLMKNVERAMQAEAVAGSEGEPVGEYQYDGSVANRALELLGKELGMFVDRSENVNVNYDVSDEPQDEAGWSAEAATQH